MRLLTLTELLRLTRRELLALLREAATEITISRRGSPEREIALRNLCQIQRALAWPHAWP